MEPFAYSLAKFWQKRGADVPYSRTRSGFLLFQHLPALVHAGLEVEVVRTAQFAGILVLGIGRLLQRVRRAAHATPRGRCFSSGNGHNGPLGVLRIECFFGRSEERRVGKECRSRWSP